MTTIPPQARTSLWHSLTKAATGRNLPLQVCDACNHVHYPPREICGNCLSPKLTWRDVNPKGMIRSSTALHVTLDPYFSPALPLPIGLVELEIGPVLYCFVPSLLLPGTKVSVHAITDGSTQAVLHAGEIKT